MQSYKKKLVFSLERDNHFHAKHKLSIWFYKASFALVIISLVTVVITIKLQGPMRHWFSMATTVVTISTVYEMWLCKLV